MNLEISLKYNGILRAMQLSICIALFTFSTFRGLGQNNTNLDSRLLAEANYLFQNENYDDALIKVNLASEEFIKNGVWEKLIDCQDLLFYIGYVGDKFSSVLPILESNYILMDDSHEREKAFLAFYLATAEYLFGNTINGQKYYKRARVFFLKLNNLSYLSSINGNLGTIYTRFGDYSRANKYIKESLELALLLGETDVYNSNIFNLARNYYFQGDYKESEKLFLQYFSLYPDEKLDVYYNLSLIKMNQNQLDSARIYFLKAKKFNSLNYYSEADFNELYSDILCKEGNIDGAINFLSKNETEVLISENKRDKGIYFYKLANLYSKKESWEESLLNFNKSLQAFTSQEISINNLHEFSQKKFLFNEIWIGDILIGLAKVYHARFINGNQEEDRTIAKECIKYALEALDYKRSFFEDIESSIFANKKSKQLYETAIDIYLEWYEECGKKEYLNVAFEISQRHNAFVLRQQINERVILEKYKVDEALKKLYLNQKLKVLEFSYVLENDYSQTEFKKLKIEEERLDSITNVINEKHPLFQSAKNNFTVTSAKQIQKHLDKNRAVIKYFEGSDKLYSFVITKKKISYFVHENINEIKEQITQARAILSNFRYSISDIDSIEREFLEVSFKLFGNILSKEIKWLPKRVKNLVIIPTGTLTQIPFESLVSGKEMSWTDPTQYVTSEFAISYNYFCKELASPVIRNELEKVLTYGLEYDEYTLNASKKMSNDSISKQIIEKFRSEDMGYLYFADDEANEVAEMFDGTSFVNENATKQNFISNVLDYDIVHLSAHSFVDFQNPSNSSIIFSKKDSLTDNMLKIKDVDRMTLNGQLFTLSACNTFYGKKNEGEGLSSMARSFIQSGAGSVVGSFWSVPDEISKSFMVHFYSKLKEGLPKDEALQATKLDFMTDDNLSSPLYRSPAYWSAWVIYGDTQSIYKENSLWKYFGCGVFLIVILLFLKQRRYININKVSQ